MYGIDPVQVYNDIYVLMCTCRYVFMFALNTCTCLWFNDLSHDHFLAVNCRKVQVDLTKTLHITFPGRSIWLRTWVPCQDGSIEFLPWISRLAEWACLVHHTFNFLERHWVYGWKRCTNVHVLYFLFLCVEYCDSVCLQDRSTLDGLDNAIGELEKAIGMCMHEIRLAVL